jgi:cytochrome c-type biogenesis protein
MELLSNILENSQYTVVTALILGLMTAISPCPLATNISAIGFISRDIDKRKRVFVNGLIYTLGRAISYTGLALTLEVLTEYTITSEHLKYSSGVQLLCSL